jgi:sialate O-acetylesterase
MVGSKELNKDTKEVKEPLRWFEIAGKDGIWKPAEVHIIANNKIEVYHSAIENPVYVRYA